MRTYHPQSWSQQAREMADNMFNNVIYYTYTHPEKWPDVMKQTPEQAAIEFFQTSYRHPLIRERAAGRFGRLLREYKRKKNIN